MCLKNYSLKIRNVMVRTVTQAFIFGVRGPLLPQLVAAVLAGREEMQ
jgi:hypothetical protein